MSLSNETKELFNAPWTIEEEAALVWYCVIDSKDSVVANDVRDQKTVNRLAHLPELYEALTEAAVKYCPELGSNFDSCDTCSVKKCEVREWVNLLKKVKEGK